MIRVKFDSTHLSLIYSNSDCIPIAIPLYPTQEYISLLILFFLHFFSNRICYSFLSYSHSYFDLFWFIWLSSLNLHYILLSSAFLTDYATYYIYFTYVPTHLTTDLRAKPDSTNRTIPGLPSKTGLWSANYICLKAKISRDVDYLRARTTTHQLINTIVCYN